MTWKNFYQLTEIYTTPLDLCWLLLSASFSYLNYGGFNWVAAFPALLFLFIFHLVFNMYNNYEDFLHATNKSNYKQETSTIGSNNLYLKTIKYWMLSMGTIMVIIGLMLVIFTGWPTLLIGIIGMLLGFGYSAGPRPLDSTPISEFVVAIPIAFLNPLTYSYLGSINIYHFSIYTFFNLFLVCLLPITLSFILQLANDTCDLDDDIANNRHTLVYFIKPQNSIKLFFGIFWLSILIVPILVLFKIIPLLTILTLLLYPLAYKGCKIFLHNQNKKEVYTQHLVKNTSLIMMVYIILFVLGTILDKLI